MKNKTPANTSGSENFGWGVPKTSMLPVCFTLLTCMLRQCAHYGVFL